jgi:hypothetical protein
MRSDGCESFRVAASRTRREQAAERRRDPQLQISEVPRQSKEAGINGERHAEGGNVESAARSDWQTFDA